MYVIASRSTLRASFLACLRSTVERHRTGRTLLGKRMDATILSGPHRNSICEKFHPYRSLLDPPTGGFSRLLEAEAEAEIERNRGNGRGADFFTCHRASGEASRINFSAVDTVEKSVNANTSRLSDNKYGCETLRMFREPGKLGLVQNYPS